MRKFILVLFLLLFTLPTAFSFPFSFDFEDPITLDNIRIDDRVKGFEAEDGNWFVVYLDNSDSKVYVEKFNSAWTSQGKWTDASICFDASWCKDVDSTYWVDASGNEYIRLVTVEDDTPNPRITLWDFDIDAETFTQIAQGGNGVGGTYYSSIPAIDISAYQLPSGEFPNDEILVMWDRGVTFESPRFTNENVFSTTAGGDGEATLSQLYKNPTDIQVAWCNQHYYVGAFNDTTDSLFIHTFEINALNELDWIGISLGIASGGGTDMSNDDWNFYSEVTEQGTPLLRMIALDRTSKDVYFYSWSCEDNGQLVPHDRIVNDFSDIAILDEFDYQANNVVLRFDMEDLSSPIQDASGYNNDGVYNGTSFGQSGVFKDALGFNGVDDGIAVPDHESIDINDTSFTAIVWIFTDDVFTQRGQLFDKNDNVISGYQAYVTPNNPVTFSFNAHVNTKGEGELVSYTFNQWMQLAVRQNATHIQLFVNGVQQGNPSAYASAVIENNLDLVIGHNATDIGYAFEGRLDQFALFDDALNDSQIKDLYDEFAITDMITKPFLTKDSTGLFRAFYQFKDPDTSAYSLMTIGNFGDCACEPDQPPWIPQDICEYDRQKFTRVCSPISCELNLSYWDTTTYCAKQFNESSGIFKQEYEWEFGDSDCSSDWVQTGEEARCNPAPLKIPVNCVNITAFAISVPEVDGDGEDDGNFTIRACTPSIDCEEKDLNCDQILNDSVNYLIDTEDSLYQAGDTITGLSTFRADYSCRDRGIADFSGFNNYRVHGALTFGCQVACEEEWFCRDEQHEAFKRIDCRPTNSTPCDFGCNEDTGRCHVSATEEGAEGEGALNIFDESFYQRILAGNLTTTEKLIGALAISGMLGAMFGGFVTSWIPNMDEHGIIIFLLGFGVGMVLFTTLGWINILWVVVLAFVVLGGFAIKNLG